MRKERDRSFEESDDAEVARLVRDELDDAVARDRERLADMDQRVLAKIDSQSEPMRRRPSQRWFTPAMRPTWAMAVVALLALVFVGGLYVGTQMGPSLSQQGVEFAVHAPDAANVSMAISYPTKGKSEWQPIPMNQRNGVWSVSLSLPPGTYEYGYKIDGQWWANDPAADYLVSGAGDVLNAVREIEVQEDET